MSGVNNGQPAPLSPEEALQALIRDQDLERLEDLLAEFNLFDVLGIARRELQHSALLAWLLDPRGSHGLRDYFLRRFLSEAAAEASERGIADVTPLDVDGWKLSDIEVATERHNMDIMLIDEADEFVCLIENKIGAGEHSGQLSRYLKKVESEYEGLTPFPIFLTPDAMEPEAEDDVERYVTLDYGKVADLVNRTLETRRSTISASVAGFLEQYVRTLRRHVLDNADNIDELALRIYNNHQAAIDLIINAKPALEAKGWDVIEAAIASYAPGLQYKAHSKSLRQFFSLSLDEVPQLKQDHMVTFDFRRDSGMTLHLYVQPGPEEVRESLLQLARNTKPFHVARKSSKKYSRIYRKPILSQQDYNPFDPDEARPKVEKAIDEFYDNDYWTIVNAIRGEFGLSATSRPGARAHHPLYERL